MQTKPSAGEKPSLRGTAVMDVSHISNPKILGVTKTELKKKRLLLLVKYKFYLRQYI